MTLPVPTEATEQMILVRYLRLRGLPHFRVPSETYTTSWKQKRTNKDLGVVRGVPDIWVVVNGRLIAIEMKRLKGSATSPEQKEWIETLNGNGVPARICKGAEEAIKFIQEKH